MLFPLFVFICFLLIVAVSYLGFAPSKHDRNKSDANNKQKDEKSWHLNQRQALMRALVLASLVCGVSLVVWKQLITEQPEAPTLPPFKNGEMVMAELQEALTEDPNNGKNWFSLGQMYMQTREFASAITCFDYSIRLSHNPYAGQYAAIATAKYYAASQSMTPEVMVLLNKALEMDPQNDTALLLIASDHFLNSRYEDAITQWTIILDSNRQGVKRAALIEKINQAKALL
ncbi:hypothetical protein [Vibrio sp. 10N.261.51.F12]|uniref:TPR domain-containing protein n=1 Tax=Vibrio sp. 10N.261.51.F12 TaxID=3229679 RepID=UPI003550B45C